MSKIVNSKLFPKFHSLDLFNLKRKIFICIPTHFVQTPGTGTGAEPFHEGSYSQGKLIFLP